MKWRQIVDDYFTFTRKDRIGLLVVLLLICLVIFVPKFFSAKFKSRQINKNDTAWIATIQKLETSESKENYKDYSGDDDNASAYQYDRPKEATDLMTKSELFYFDPNTISVEEWKRLGLREKTIHTIQNFLGKGGHFYKPADLKKIYGLHTDVYERLAPYIQIENKNPSSQSITQKEVKSPFVSVEINLADTTALIALPGIGSRLAARIINFRDKLGGFYSVDQIKETYGLPDSTFQKIKPYLQLNNKVVKKININTATVEELRSHPYIKYSLANPIVAYRNEHGPFPTVEDIKRVMAVTDDIYNKIAPYLTVQ